MIANQSGTITLLFKTTQAYKKNNKKNLYSRLYCIIIFSSILFLQKMKKVTLYLLVFDCRPYLQIRRMKTTIGIENL